MDTTGSVFLPPAGSTIASDVDPLWNFIFYVSVILFALVGGAIVFFLVRYRRRTEGELTSGVDHNLPLEIVWTAVPTVLILIVFVWGFKGFLKMQVPPGDAIEVKVTGQRWFWTFDYPDGVNSVNELVVPVDKPVKLLMSSTDVIHSFYVPNFRIKMDVVPNRYTITWFEATRTGDYNLFCTEYCGKGHSEMLGVVRVVNEREYDEWLEKSTSGEGMTLEEFGKSLYTRKACNTCHSLDGSKLVGPSFKGAYGRLAIFKDGTQLTIDENYIRESILNPQAKVAAGYDPVMPSYQGILKDRQIDALIAYIRSLQGQEGI
jgi:cytochrome c oxidase subunit 2